MNNAKSGNIVLNLQYCAIKDMCVQLQMSDMQQQLLQHGKDIWAYMARKA